MKILLQNNVINAEDINHAISRLNFPLVRVNIKPFMDEMDPPINGLDFIPYGSTLFTEMSYKRNFKGLCYNPSTFKYSVGLQNRNDMLNSDGIVASILDVIELLKNEQDQEKLWFIRPDGDLKEFSGQILTTKEWLDWLTDANQCSSQGTYKLEDDFFVVMASPKIIQAEWRCFIVDHEIVSVSQYKQNGRLIDYKLNGTNKSNSDTRIITMAKMWLPHDCCVMDVAQVNNEFKVVEFNTINSSGFYGADAGLVLTELFNYFQTK